MRKEDYDFVKDASGEYVDILQCNNAASSRTPRGHQFPGAFMHQVESHHSRYQFSLPDCFFLKVAGLDKHMTTSKVPLKYTHLDVAGSSGYLPDVPTAASVVAVVMNAIGK